MTDGLPYPMPEVKNFKSGYVFGTNLLLRKWPKEKESKGGIALPDAAQSDRLFCWVEMVGPGVPMSSDIKPGYTVIVPAHDLVSVNDLGDDIFICDYEDLAFVYPLAK